MQALADGSVVSIQEFKSKAEYSGINRGEQALATRKCSSVGDAVDAMIADMKIHQDHRPMIFFTDHESPDELFQRIKRELREDTKCWYVKGI